MANNERDGSLEAITQRLAACEQRLEAVEDQLAILNLMTRYGLAADSGNDALAMACHTQDAVYRVSAPRAGRGGDDEDLVLEGRSAIGAMLRSELHQSMLPNTAHTVGPSDIRVAGDTAEAVGYSRLYLREAEAPRLMRLAINQWAFRKEGGTWLIASRTSTLVGEEAAQAILRSLG
ncbi:MAG: nuclear transport factor 2 family protein [Halioglobus sp.]|nr:nuclear transport factor 2 family protein [Halioglobus sp.]